MQSKKSNPPKRKRKDLFHKTMERYPMFMNHLVEDILQFDGYTETDIAFGSGTSLDAVRALFQGRNSHIDRKMFQELVHFYSRTVCGWCSRRYKDRDFEYYPE